MNTITPYKWQLPLIDRQTDALHRHGFFVNACGTGAGKTVMALASASRLNAKTLVVAPLVSHEQWRRTARAMGIEDLLLDVINIEKISRGSAGPWYDGDKWYLPPNALVILDECHRGTSGPKSKATEAFGTLKSYPSIRLLAMSATLASSPTQLRLIGYWAGLHQFNKPSFSRFMRSHGCSYEEVYDLQLKKKKFVLAFTRDGAEARRHMARIRDEMGDRIMAYGPKDIPDFPTETISVELLDLARRDRKELEDAYRSMGDKIQSTGIKLVDCLHERMLAERAKAKAMAELAVSYVQSITDNYSVVLFVSFTETREMIERCLREAGVEFRSVYGGMDSDERQKGIDEFQDNKVHCLVCMSQAASCAMSAHDARHERMRVSIISPSYSASDMKQALGRIRRCGGTHATQIFVLAKGSIEEQVAKALQRKIDSIDTLNDSDLVPKELT